MDDVYRERAGLSRRYSLENRGNRFNFEWLHDTIAERLRSIFGELADLRLLDLGAGELFWTEKLIQMGLTPDNCIASDLLWWRLADGREQGRMIDAVTLSAAALPFGNDRFDLVSQLTMMTSVLDSNVRQMIAYEMKRVLKPGGYILWYDFRYDNPGNRNTRAIGLREMRHLFEGMDIRSETITLVPQLARKIGPALYPLLKFAAGLPILRTHYLAFIGPKG